MQDFAAGTSSRSTKLVHGGLRYLKQLEVKIVAETGRERDIVYHNAVHVTQPQWMLLPFYKGGSFGKYTTSAGLFAYDFLAGVKKDERREMLTPEETIEKEPILNSDGLLGGGYYVEYKTDDARLTIEIMKKAAEKGAQCLNYMKAESFIYDNEKVNGVVVSDMLGGAPFTIHASTIVNAAGPWVDEVRQKDQISNSKRLRLTKGVHLVIDRKVLPLRQAIYFDAPDGRMIFAIPRGDKAYIGTTDTLFDGDCSHPVANEEDIDYLLETIHHMFPTTNVLRENVESTWAGVRPLIFEEGKNPSEISRKDEVWQAESGLITIAGGKLTGYRKMAETVVDLVVRKLPMKSYEPCSTENLPLSGGDFNGFDNYTSFIKTKSHEAILYGLTKEEGERLATFYGTNVDAIFTYAHALQADQDPLPLSVKAEIFYAIHHEMAMTPSDFFIRRTASLYFNIEFVETYKAAVSDYMAKLLSYTEREYAERFQELNENIADAKVDGGVPR